MPCLPLVEQVRRIDVQGYVPKYGCNEPLLCEKCGNEGAGCHESAGAARVDVGSISCLGYGLLMYGHGEVPDCENAPDGDIASKVDSDVCENNGEGGRIAPVTDDIFDAASCIEGDSCFCVLVFICCRNMRRLPHGPAAFFSALRPADSDDPRGGADCKWSLLSELSVQRKFSGACPFPANSFCAYFASTSEHISLVSCILLYFSSSSLICALVSDLSRGMHKRVATSKACRKTLKAS